MPSPSKSVNSTGTAARNIESILRIEKEDEQRLLLHHRLFHAVGHFVGTPYFFIFQSLGVALWVWINTQAPTLRFDEYPFPLLAILLALEAVLLTSCVLIRQNIAEIAEHLRCPIQDEAQSEDLSDETAVDSIARDLRAREDEQDEERKA